MATKIVNDQQLVQLTIDDGALLKGLGSLDRPGSASVDEVEAKQEQIYEVIDQRKQLEAKAAYDEKLRTWKAAESDWRVSRSRWEESNRLWQEAVERWHNEQQNAARLGLNRMFGPQIDSELAAKALPYAMMLGSTENANHTMLAADGWTAPQDWQEVLKRHGYLRGQIDVIKGSGFRAMVFGNVRTGEVTVAFDLSADAVNYKQGFMANIANRDIQFKAAADLARIVRDSAGKNSIISLTGSEKGGSLAVYAGEQVGISHVITFNAPMFPPFAKSENREWTNISWIDE